jgi:DNA polymerase III epsilon subunit-like protein
MRKSKRKTITELRNSLFETFEEVAIGEDHLIYHKNISIGYAQAIRGEGISSADLKEKLKNKEIALRKKHFRQTR